MDYVNCRKYGEGYKEEDEDNKQILLQIGDNKFDQGMGMARKGFFPDRGDYQNKERAKSVGRDKSGYITTEVPEEENQKSALKKKQRISSSQEKIQNRQVIKNDYISNDGKKVKISNNIYAPNRENVGRLSKNGQ